MSCLHGVSPVPVPPPATSLDLPAQLVQRGFKPGLPLWIPPRIADIDRRVCRSAICGNCNKRGLLFIPYVRLLPRSYAICARCPSCGFCEEF